MPRYLEKLIQEEKKSFPLSEDYRELVWMIQAGDDDLVSADDYKPIAKTYDEYRKRKDEINV